MSALNSEPEQIDQLRRALQRVAEVAGDGYEFAAAVAQHPIDLHPVACWGARGWDLGSWPLSVHISGFVHGRYIHAVRVEGDLTLASYATEQERDAAIDRYAQYHWDNGDCIGPDDSVPDHERRGPMPRSAWTSAAPPELHAAV